MKEIALEAIAVWFTLNDQLGDPHPDCDCWSRESPCPYHLKLLADIRIVQETAKAALAWAIP